MYELRCPNCGWSTMMSDEQVTAALAEADKLKATHHIEHCPRCQWVIRMPVSSLREAAPATLLASPEPHLLEEGKPVAPARKSPARKPAAKRATARKSTAKKPVAKKAGAKKAAARKPVAKKPTARKSANAKKPAARRKK